VSLWELKRLGVTIGAITLLATAVAAGVCLALGAFTYQGMGNALFAVAFVLVIVGSSVGGRTMTGTFGMSGHQNQMTVAMESEMLAQQAPGTIAYERQQFKQYSWGLVLGLAAIPVFAACIVCLFVLDS
jgi:hypothetical protein